jgi:hypothetical protein
LLHIDAVVDTAELVDVASWETLFAMAENFGQDDIVKRFSEALTHEKEHLSNVRSWYGMLTLEGGDAAPTRMRSKANRELSERRPDTPACRTEPV